MNRRSLVAATALAAAALCGVALAPRAEAQRGSGVTFGTATLTPKSLNSMGGQVTVKIKVTSRVVISSVQSRASVPGTLNRGPVANLTDNGRGVYTGTISVPANLNKRAQTSSVFVSVTTANGTVERKVGTVKVKGNSSDPNQPPPPPPI